jgi:hypothetical protein
MNKLWSASGRGILLLALAGQAGGEAWGGSSDENEPLIVRVVHPDRQAAEFLRLFEGSRAASPAAALARWKRATRNPDLLGKPLEAVIAMCNPDMVAEWKVLDGAELQLGFDPDDGSPQWFAIVSHDDGTVAAAITAARLTHPDDEPLREKGRETPVARLGRSGAPLAAQVGSRLTLGSSRADLLRGIHSIPSAFDPAYPLDSGLFFRLDAKRLTTPRSGSLGLRRTVEALHGMDCRRVEGTLALADGRLTFDMATTLGASQPPHPVGTKPQPTVESAWLEHFPAANVMAIVSMAVDPGPAFWDRAFSLADRIERVDPARAGVALLRTRINLLAVAAGVKPEADLWPHLRGVSACIWGDPRQPGQPIGAALMLHVDEESNAERLTREFVSRLGSLLPSRARDKHAPSARRVAAVPERPAPGEPKRVGIILGRNLSVWRHDRDVMIAWGDETLTAPLESKVSPARSLATVYNAWGREGRGAPQRFGAFWPGRLFRPGARLNPAPATLRAFADDPPVVWRGWNESNRAHDRFQWPDLAGRVRRFLETIPLAPPQVP